MAPIDEKMSGSHLKWFNHVQRRETNSPIRKNELSQVKGTKKKPLVEVIGKYMTIKGITKSVANPN